MLTKSEKVYQVVIHIAIALVALSCLFPLFYVIGMSLTSQSELIARNYFVIIPEQPTFAAYERVLSSPLVWKAFSVSVMRSVIGSLLTLALTVIGAYVLACKTLPGRNWMLFLVLATILFHAGLIPTYLVIQKMGLINSFWAMIVPMLVDSFGLLIIKIFIENLPDGVLESAKMDGAGEFTMLYKIVVPLAAPSLAAIGMFNVVGHWNNWFDALIYLNDKNMYPLQLVLRNMLTMDAGVNDQMNFMLMDTQRVSSESMKMATVVLGIIPVMCVYPFLQKHFIKGMFLGSVKG